MEIKRNQYFLVGVILLLLGLQLRMVDSFVLNDKATQFLARRTSNGSSTTTAILNIAPAPLTNKVIKPPEWLGWCLISLGAVLILHSLVLKGT